MIQQTLELGRRIELYSMDQHCHNISLALYCRQIGQAQHVLVHTYSLVDGARQRVNDVTNALMVRTGLELVNDGEGWLRFPCDGFHQRALTRTFLDVCKFVLDDGLEAEPLKRIDKKAGCHLIAKNLGQGVYRFDAEESSEAGQKRAEAMTRGFVKLCGMEPIAGHGNQAAFSCGVSHDNLIGSLMFRAQNLRAVMREEAMNASRGVLSSPSQQE
mgnify:CR=1 FL=1